MTELTKSDQGLLERSGRQGPRTRSDELGSLEVWARSPRRSGWRGYEDDLAEPPILPGID
ncbi:hypothetical protein ACFSNO_34410 [Streptomyces cirratus]